MKKTLLILFLALVLVSCKDKTDKQLLFKSDSFEIEQLTENIYVHITFLETQDFGKVACNGLIYVNQGEAVVFDTPTNDAVSTELIDWIKESLRAEVRAVVINHSHDDCLGGIGAFHKLGIPSYSNQETITLAQSKNLEAPKIGFKSLLELNVGDQKVINRFSGAGHTSDNITSYIPAENVLFGGCMIKSLGAGKGNLADASLEEWSKTVEKVKNSYPDLLHVVPGHGATGDVALLNYTIEMFRDKK